MLNLFLSVFKKRRVIFFILLLSVLTGVSFPQIVSAAWTWNCILGIGWCVAGHFWPDAANTASTYTFNAIIVALGTILILLTSFPATLAHELLRGIMSLPADIGGFIFGSSYTQITGPNANVVVAVGWPIVRDFANIIVVLGFIGIALATILRWPPEYDAKKLLAKLIIAALLINFSLVICGIVIDVSNVVVREFIGAGNSDTFGRSFTTSIKSISDIATTTFRNDVTNPANALSKVAAIVFFNIMATIIFTLFFFLFIFRYIALWILVILSPLAFVCAVFPYTQKFYETWKNNFVQWCIIGIPGAFSIYLANEMTARIIANRNPNQIDPTAYIVPGLLLIGGFLFSIQTSAMGAGIAISGGVWMKNKTVGASKWAGKWASDNTGLTRLKDRAMYGATRLGERAYLINRGTADANWKKQNRATQVDEQGRKERTDEMTTQQKLDNLASGAFTTDAHLDNAAILKSMTKEQWALLDDDQQMEYLRKYQTYGAKPHELVDKMSTANQQQIATGTEFNPKAREAATNALAAKNQLSSSLTQPELIAALEGMRQNGFELDAAIKGAGGQSLADLITQHQVNMDVAHGGSGVEILSPEIRRKITEALADRKQLDLIGNIGESIAVRRERKVDAIIEAAQNGGLPENLVSKLNSDDKAAVLNDEALLLNSLTGQQRTQVIGKATESLMKSGETNLITPSARRNEIFETAVQSGGLDVEDGEDKDYHFGGHNTRRLISVGAPLGITEAMINDAKAAYAEPAASRTPAQIAAIAAIEPAQRAARVQVLSENIKRMRGDQLRRIDATDLQGAGSYAVISKLTSDQIREFQTAPAAVRTAIRASLMTHLNDLDEEIINAAEGYPPGTDYAQKAVNGGAIPADVNLRDSRERGRLQKIRAAIVNLTP